MLPIKVKGETNAIFIPDSIRTATFFSFDWSKYLRDSEPQEVIETLRKNVTSGRPCGDEDFIKSIEKIVGRPLRVLPRGRPRKR